MKKAIIITLILLIPSIVVAQGYYADVEVNVNEEGTVTMTGLTNHPLLSVGESDEFTSKQGKYWTLNISINDSFDYYVLKTVLPRGAVINYLLTPKSVQISEELGRISITSLGNNESLNLITQYSIRKYEVNFLWTLLIIPAILIPLYLKKRPKKKKIDYSTLTEREARIVKALVKGQMTQKELEGKIKIPKSSLSRNINSLIRKGLVVKKKKGMSNIIMLK